MSLKNSFQLIFEHSKSSTALQTLYDGYQYFEFKINEESCVIAYVDTPTAWIGASDPVVSQEEHLTDLLREFKDAARKKNKQACLLPTSTSVAKAARKLGYYTLQIGSEPWISVPNDFTRSIPNSRQLYKKGARVQPFNPTQLSVRERLELDDLTERWMDTRKMATLSFLNRVEPWSLLKYKAYFRVLYRGRQVGYLAAIPIPSINAWYLVDLVRSKDAPVGTTELLITESATFLKGKGAKEITLGLAPFAPVDAIERDEHYFTYSLFEKLFHRSTFFYNFKPLLSYKQKFNPNRWEPNYFIYLGNRPNLRLFYGLFLALFPKGILHTLVKTGGRVSRRNNFEKFYQRVLSSELVPKSPPQGWLNYFTRVRFSFFLILLNVFCFYVSTDSHGNLRNTFSERYAYDWNQFFEAESIPHSFLNLIAASFVHWNFIHLFTNLFMIAVFVSFLECILGARAILFSYTAGFLFSNPLTSLVFYPLLKLVSPERLSEFLLEKDVGASLGIFACLGTFAFFSRYPAAIVAFFSLITIIHTMFTHGLMGYNHLVALGIGFFVARVYSKI